MIECPECGEKINEDELERVSPYCGQTDNGDGIYICEGCQTTLEITEDLWECFFCHNEGVGFEGGECRCPECGEPMDDESYCYSCGWPNNQGWIGEHYR